MSALATYRAMLSDVVGPALREAGLRGSRGRWWLRTELGDYGIIEMRTSSTSSRHEVRFQVTLSVAPAPWLARRAAEHVPAPRTGPRVEDGLWSEVIAPDSPMLARYQAADPTWWAFKDDPLSALVGMTIADLLVEQAVPRLRQLLDRQVLCAALRRREDPAARLGLAALLADEAAQGRPVLIGG